jgi:hypothetical protein
MARIKISELAELNIATLDTTYVVGASGSGTYKIPISRLTSSLDTTFASDLVVNAISGTISTLATTASVNTLSTSVDSRLDTLETFSSSANNRYVLSGSITQTTWDNIANKPAGIVSQSTDLSSLNTISASYLLFTQSYYSASASFDERIIAATNEQDLSYFATTGSNIFIGEQTISGSIIPAVSGAYDLGSITNPWKHIYVNTGSIFLVKDAQIVKVLNTNTIVTTTDIASGSVNLSTTLPIGVISGSTQISDLGFVTGSYTTLNSFNNLTQSFNSISQSFTTISGSFGDIDFSGINAITSSYLSFTQSYYSASASFDSRVTTEKNRIDAILSASNANSDTFAEVVSLINSVDLTNDNAFAIFYTASNNRITSLENATSSYLTSLNGAISSSAQVLNGSGIFSSSAQLPTGLLSSSLGFVVTSSYTTDSASFNSRIISGSAVAGTISGSSQIAALGYATTSSVTTISASAWGAFQSASSYSSSLATSISASNYNITINSASVSSISSSFVTSISASNANITALSSSNATTDNTQTTNITAASASAWGAFQSASSYSGSLQTSISASNYNITINSASVSSLSSSFNTRVTANSASAWGAFQTASANSSSLASSIASVSGTFTDLTINGSRVNANGVITTDFINAGRITSDQTSMGSGSDIIFNSSVVSSGISLNTSTGIFTLTANKTYKLFAELSFANFSDLANGYIIYDWVDATTNTRLDTSGISAGIGEHINRNTNEFNATSTTLIYRPTTNQTVKVRIVEGAGTVTVRQSIGTKAIIEQINSSFALNTTSGGINYTQVLGNQRSGLTADGTSIVSGSITTTGKPVQVIVTGDANPTSGAGLWAILRLYRDSTPIGNAVQVESSAANENIPYCLNFIDTPSAGTYSYSLRLITPQGTWQFGEAAGPVLTAMELGSLTVITDTNNIFTGTNTFRGETTFSSSVKIGAGGGSEGGEIALAYAPTNSTLTGSAVSVDIYQNRLRIFEGGGNARGVYVDLSKAPNGVGGELLWKASGFVDAGVDVTLGNLKARIPTTGNKSLQLSTVSGTYSVYGSSVYSYNGVGAITLNNGTPLNVTTTPQYLAAGYNFIVAGATDTWNIMDTSAGIAWRITMIIGAGYLNNFISIERL